MALDRVSGQRFLFDCDRTDPASDFVVALYFELDSTCEARSSIRAPVCLAVPACASADPARLREVAEAFGLPSIEPAFDAIPPEVPFVFLDILFSNGRLTPHLADVRFLFK